MIEMSEPNQALPELPQAFLRAPDIQTWGACDVYTADQMREYAREAIRRGDAVMWALRAATDWIEHAPHGDDCFVSDHYEGDPGNRCNCGKERALQMIEDALASSEPGEGLDGAEYEFEVWQNDDMQAGGSGSPESVLAEASHYAMMYGQDGEVELRYYVRYPVSEHLLAHPPTAATQPNAAEHAIIEQCMLTEAVTPDLNNPGDTLRRVIDWHVMTDRDIATQPEQVRELDDAMVARFMAGYAAYFESKSMAQLIAEKDNVTPATRAGLVAALRSTP